VKATEVTAGPAESNGSLLPGLRRDSLHVTCGLTACTPGSAPGPTLGNEYGKTLPLKLYLFSRLASLCVDSVTGGELLQRFINEDNLTESEAAYYLRQLLLAVEYMHSRNVIHLDLKVAFHTCRSFNLL